MDSELKALVRSFYFSPGFSVNSAFRASLDSLLSLFNKGLLDPALFAELLSLSACYHDLLFPYSVGAED